MVTKSTRSGPRQNSGRPKGEGSQMIRIPNSLVEPVKNIIKAYKMAQQSRKE